MLAGTTEGASMTPSTRTPPVQALPAERSFVGRMILRGKRIASRKSVKHLIRAITRYGDRLGSQFAGAMTYFSVLSLVPILMVGFAIGGIVLANNQQLLNGLKDQITEVLADEELATQITDVINDVVDNPLGVGIPGLLIALYAGIGWMGNLRKATRAIWRPEFEENKAEVDSIIIATLKDLGSLAGLAVAITVSLGLSTLGAQFQTTLLNLLGLGDQEWLTTVVAITTILIAMAADILIFLWVYT
ncbi:MAG TPA: YhjD/YihY/BrkB family envelope integrity protein, partial [Nakamurella sp.]|nr:YhjD/YihY/BrkB family envelope integrity protein [Nakamurella sp.]